MRYRPELDGMRALAVLAVVASHLALPYAAGGWMGVDVFFVLSGYLITSLLLTEQDRFGSISLGRFYSRRVLRLYPALIAVILLGVPFFHVLAESGSLEHYGEAAAISGLYLSDFAAGFGHLGTLGDLGATWSLAVEEHFYLLWPPVLILLLRHRRNVLGWTAVAGGVSLASLIALSYLASPDGISDTAYYLPSSRFSTLLLGCVMAVMLHRGARIPLLERAWAGAGLSLAIVALVLAANHFGRYPNFAWEAPAIGIFSAALVWHVTTANRSPVSALLSLRPFVWLGRRSYGIYLYHVPVLLILQLMVFSHLPVGRIVFSIAAYVAAIGIAALSYRFIELPFLRLKKRFSPGGRTAVAAPRETAAA
ncbi:acyltransferase family protein [Gryllotalpicola reticulitermitis]|uniref:Acyltransferase family protein n=1 Tax=Gryllotalpicola reticulitermitis TaxID=1184153 RepID=A0ABV8Q8B9_9MICO